MGESAARVPLLEREEVSAEAQAAYDHVAQTRGGQMGNIFKALVNSPGALEEVAAVGEFVRSGSTLRRGLQELVILTVAHEVRSVYEWTLHWRVVEGFAERLHITPEVMGMIGTAQLERQPDPVGAAVRYTRLVARGDEVDDTTVAALKSALGDAGLVELTVCVGYYLLLSRLIDALRVPLDGGVEPRPFPPYQ